MNKNIILTTLLAALMLLSCQKDTRKLAGDYNYKLSGEVELRDAEGEVTYQLIHRIGQMQILRDKSQKSKYLITMNEMNGGGYTMTAELRGDSLLLDEHTFSTNVLSSSWLPNLNQDETPSLVYRVTATGGGTFRDGSLILRETWTGSQSGAPTSTINSLEMNIIAEKN